ncbi:hypothetical protein DCAR_0933513 [Daucus carota subsp. sativus]|uniref:S-protein homolog n=1 Tax=Daucus carota subsp. sativus TaxID=79200 RepID=A0AAF0XTH0_DAUCS|nr:PREDICTED: uncharacterized protein LOC108201033 [Daucus carota subsp. sativus]WOH13998.1 hypothetical protein DCAR_0933513 [Daucus carota subsp. sativus]
MVRFTSATSIFCVFVYLLMTTCLSKFHINITNRLPNPPLILHCKSKDDDLGYHNLTINQLYTWSFRDNFWDTTLFWCNFWYNRKHAGFDVYNRHIRCDNTCYYEARIDGFYLSKTQEPGSWQKISPWNNSSMP